MDRALMMSQQLTEDKIMNLFTKLTNLQNVAKQLREDYQEKLAQQVTSPREALLKDLPSTVSFIHAAGIMFAAKRVDQDGERYYIPFSFQKEGKEVVLNDSAYKLPEEAKAVLALLYGRGGAE